MTLVEVTVGRIGRPHGLRGEVTVEVRTDEPDRRFATGATLVLREPQGAGERRVTVAGARWHQGRLLVRLEEVTDRDAAEAVRGRLLAVTVPAQERPADDEEFYDHQLVGLTVVTSTGRPVGTVESVSHTGAQDLLEIALDGDAGRTVQVPFVAALVPRVDLAAGLLEVDDRPGLLDPEG